jgi:hypothetical protein
LLSARQPRASRVHHSDLIGERMNQTMNFTAKSPLSWLYAALTLGILLAGVLALFDPFTASVLFGRPVKTVDDYTWVRLAGMRDIAIGMMFAAMLVCKEQRIAGILVLLTIVVPVGDAFTVFSARGASYQVFIHGGAAIFMAVLGMLLLKRR